MDFTRPFTRTSPIFTAASAEAQDFLDLERGGALGGELVPIELEAAQDGAQERTEPRDYGVCTQRMGDDARACVDT